MKKSLLIVPFLATVSLFAGSIQYTAYAKVRTSVPEYENVIERTPHEECWTEEIPVTYYETYDAPQQQYSYSNPQGGDTTAGAIIGGVAGGVLGHQIGKGRGKDVATVAGAVLGTLAGRNMAEGSRQGGHAAYSQPRRVAKTRYEHKQRCKTTYTEREVRSFKGYKNIAWFKGKKIVKYSDRKLKRIPLTITVTY